MRPDTQDRYWLIVRDKPALLMVMMRFLAGDAQISFEGDLSNCDFPLSIPHIAENQTILHRQTIAPELDFMTFALEPETIQPILEIVLPERRYMDEIIHIQIEKQGELQFGCYDNFHKDCIVCFLGVAPEFLDELKQKGIIKSWTTPFEGAARWHG